MSRQPIQKLDLSDINNNFHIITKPKNSHRYTLKQYLKYLTIQEFLIYCACQCYSLREIAQYFKRSHMFVKRVYERACRKLEAEKRRNNAS